MPIIDNDTQVTVEFPYDSSETGTRLWVKYHILDGFPTISVSENKSEWFNFPASLFSDVTDYLRQKSLISASSVSVVTKISQQKTDSFQNPSFGRSAPPRTCTLPAPQILRSNAPNAPRVSEYTEDQMADISPIENFSNISALVDKTSQTLKSIGESEKINRPVFRGETSALQRKAMSSGGSEVKRS